MTTSNLQPGGVQRPATLHGQLPEPASLQIDGASGGHEVVFVAAEVQDRGAAHVHDGGEKVGQPEAHVALGIDHADLAQDGTNVDHHVEVQVNAGDGRNGIYNDALSRREGLDVRALLAILLGDEGRDVGSNLLELIGETAWGNSLETTGTHTHDD